MGVRRFYLTFAMLSCAGLLVGAPRKLIWGDDFSGPAGAKPDPSHWTYDLGNHGGWGNQELETYTNNADNAHLDGEGHLVIQAMKNASEGYTSARIRTQGLFSFEYGRAEARMKLPKGRGMWPAFWLLGSDIQSAAWPVCGEIDIMENLGREPALVHGTVHGPGYSGAHGITAEYALPGKPALSDAFHVYAVDWKPGRIEFSIDQHVYATVTPASLPPGAKWVYNHSFFVILNLAVGGGWPGNPDETTVFPQDLVVDYVRVYR